MGHIIWLASYPKSGNTWLRAFLANLMANQTVPVPLADLPRYCDDEALPERFQALAGRPVTELDMAQLSALRPTVQTQIAGARDGITFVKTHNFLGYQDGFPLQHPGVTAGGIYVVRNPLDVAVSMTHHFGLTLDQAIDYLGDENTTTMTQHLWVSQVLTSWSTHVGSWADSAGANLLVVRYEDLLEKPTKTFAKIAALVGVKTDRARIERSIRHARFDTLASDERRQGFVEVSDKAQRFFRVGRSNQWRNVLSADQIARIVERHREQMKRFRYIPNGY